MEKGKKQQKNRGFITVEASMVVPIFLFFLLGMAGIYMMIMAEAHIHQALAAATDYVAQYSYLEYRLLRNSTNTLKSSENKKAADNLKTSEKENATNVLEIPEISVDNLVDNALVTKQFHTYLGEDYYVEQLVDGGKNGILITVKKDAVNPKILIVTAAYQIKINLPLLGTYSINLSSQIKQKAFVGFSKEEYNNDDWYVYVTPNREAYHMRRDCTHLVLDIYTIASNYKGNYTPCYYCGKRNEGNTMYVARSGEVYHCSRDCIGLKRTVSRVKMSTVKGLGSCTRCSR